MPDWTAQERRGCCGFMSPGPVSSEPEDVFPACICRVYIYTTYINKYLYTWPATQTTGRHAEQSHKQRQNRLILFPALAKQDAGPLVIHRYNVGPFSIWAQMLSLPNNRPLDPSLPTCWHLDIWAPKTTAPLQLLLQTVTDMHTQLARASQVQATNLPELSLTSRSSQATSAIHQLLQLDLRWQSHMHLYTRTCSSHWEHGNLAFQPMVWLQLLAVRHLHTHTRT